MAAPGLECLTTREMFGRSNLYLRDGAVAGFEPATSRPVPCICHDPWCVVSRVLYPLSYTAIFLSRGRPV